MRIDWNKLVFISISVMLVLLVILLFGCKATDEVILEPVKTSKVSDCDCEKSNSQIRQENRTERKRLAEETKQKQDSLDFELKNAKIDLQAIRDSLKFATKNNRIDSREGVKVTKSDNKKDVAVAKSDNNTTVKVTKSDNGVKKKELKCWNWKDKIVYAIIWLVIGFCLHWVINLILKILK